PQVRRHREEGLVRRLRERVAREGDDRHRLAAGDERPVRRGGLPGCGRTDLRVLQPGFIWDDDSYVTANPTLQTLDGLRRIWLEPGAVPQYYPLTFTSFWIEY